MKIITRRKQNEAEHRISMVLYAFKHRDEIPEIKMQEIVVQNMAELAYIIGGTDSMITVGERADMLITSAEADRLLGRLTAQVLIETIKREFVPDINVGDKSEDTGEARP